MRTSVVVCLHVLCLIALTGCAEDSMQREADHVLSHAFGAYAIEAGGEIDGVCMSWTLGNDDELWVNSVSIDNDGLFHHSNWFFVPEEDWALPDGHWSCWDNSFTELEATLKGGVLYAQSTQTKVDAQRFIDGAAIRVPPRSRIIAYTHLLNSGAQDVTTEMRVALELLDAGEVETVLTPFRMTYSDLQIPPMSSSTFSGSCELASVYENVMDRPWTFKLHWALPHYHGLGDMFRLSLIGGSRDGEAIFALDDAIGEPLGKAFAEPVDLAAAGATGLRFTCGYQNPRSETVGFGIGDQEMCVMLGFAEGGMLFDAYVDDGTEITIDGEASGPCSVAGIRYPHAR